MNEFENDPESIMDAEREEAMYDDSSYEDAPAPYEYEDPFADWFAPGYVTEMDYLNAMEANDYLNELGDCEEF